MAPKYVRFTIKDKHNIINAVISGSKQIEVTRSFNVPTSIITSILKNNCKITTSAEQTSNSKVKRFKSPYYHRELEENLTKWYTKAINSNVQVGDNILGEKGKVYVTKLRVKDFRPSNGWSDGYQKIYNIIFNKASCVESASVLSGSVSSGESVRITKSMNNNKTAGIYYKCLPNRLEDQRYGNQSENSVTILLAANADGSKEFKSLMLGGVQVKEERPDEAEILELALRMVEANKAKLAAQAAVAVAAASSPNSRIAQNLGAGGLHAFGSNRPNSRTTPSSPAPPSTPDSSSNPDKVPMDMASQKGQFGWVMLGEEHLPYIQRGEDKYCAVRMVEMKLLVKYLSYLNPDIYSCTCIRSYFITENEARLLTEINLKHCEGRFGRESFTTKDLVVRMEDAREFYNFLELCYSKLMNPHSNINSRCGFVRINNDSVVPYTVKSDSRFVPLFYFEGETETLKKRSTTLDVWDLAYLKFCCKVQGIRSELFANDSCQVISLADIKAYFPGGTTFDEYWPPKVVDTQLLVSKPSGRGSAGSSASWIKVPHGSTTPTPAIESSRLPPTNQVSSNGWSTMLSSSPRYQSSAVPVTTQQSRVPTNHTYNVTSSSGSVNRSYIPRVNNSVSQHYYPTVSHTTGHNSLPIATSPSAQGVPQVQPPPLVRVTSSNPTLPYHSYSKDDWNTSYSCTPASVTYTCSPTIPQSNPMLLSSGLMPPPPHIQYAATHNNNNNSGQKYPPPLIPVNGTTSRYYNSSGDVIDLSSPPPSHQQSSRQAQKQQSDSLSGWSRLIPISESPARQSNHFPFKMQKALVNGKMVPCINAKPYVYSELLMTVNDLLEHFFPGASLAQCREVLQNVLQVTLYSGNLAQKSVLRDNNKCKTLTEVLPLIQLKDVMQFMPQLRYIMERHMTGSGGGESAPKRARIS